MKLIPGNCACEASGGLYSETNMMIGFIIGNCPGARNYHNYLSEQFLFQIIGYHRQK